MKGKQIIGLIIAAVIFIVTGAASVFVNTMSQSMLDESKKTMLSGNMSFDAPIDDYIAVVEVSGTIQEQTEANVFELPQGYQHTTTLKYIDELMDDDYNQGILLYVDSPGGTVYESEELYLKLMEYKEITGRPIWTYMSHYAASGGYMISMASDKIYANRNTTTGSIGVILSTYDMSGLYEKLGIKYVSITSGENKDSSKLTEDQIAIYQEQINEYYERFVEIVSTGRGMKKAEVKKLADGRTYTAKQALRLKLIDEIALYEDMKEDMQAELKVTEFYKPESEVDVLSALFAKVESLFVKSEAQILKETATEMESGVPMYYAEQLR